MKKIIALLITGITAGLAWCCVSPSNIEGVAFTSGEHINLTILTSLGTNGTNFLRDSSDAGIAVRYRSHYSNDAMVFVGSYGLAYQKSVNLNCMGIIADAEKLGSGSTGKSTFDFAQAVKIELAWMREQGIITIDNETIAAIFDSLDKSGNGGVQYWTLQKDVLGYNSWYTKDSLSGVWNTDGVNGVRSVKGTTCAGINPEYKAFAQSLAVVPVKKHHTQSSTAFRITRNAAASLAITPWNNVDNVSIVDASGKNCSMQTKAVSGGIMVSFNNQITPGVYFLKLSRGASVQTVPVLIGW
jgi:hypothetical protein